MKLLGTIFMSATMAMSSCNGTTEEVATTNENTKEVAAQEAPELSDLMVLVTMDNFSDWKTKAFDSDAERRATVCDEARTTVAKVDDNTALVLMYDVDVAKMSSFMTAEAMEELKKAFGAEHKVMPMVKPGAPGEGPSHGDVLVVVDMDDYSTWRSQAFDPDAERRATVCDEDRTLVGKVNDKKAVVGMFNVDLAGMGAFMTEEAMKELKEAFGAEHTVYALINPEA